MKKFGIFVAAVMMVASAQAFAATKTYQVTGPVTALTADSITVQKGSEKWEIARGSAAIADTIKVGSKVTIEYTMAATTVTDKSAAKPAKAVKVATPTATVAPAVVH